jgi:predicted nuclease of predicted toxin-antitoxin system
VTELFISLYLDEDVDVLVATLVRANGFDAISTQAARQAGNGDPEQLAFAIGQRRAIVTHNRDDFENLARAYAARGEEHYGIIIAVRNSPYEIRRRLLLILDHVTADEMQNQVRYI